MEMENSHEKALLSDELIEGDSTPNYDSIFGDAGGKEQKYTKQTVIGEVRNPKKFTWVEWVFFVLSLVAFSGTFGITISRFVYFEQNFTYNDTTSKEFPLDLCDDWTCTSDFTYTVLLIANIMFCFFYAIDGVLRERGFEILAVPMAIAVVMVYIIGNYIYKPDELEDGVRIARLVLAIVFGPPLAVFAVWIYIRNGRLQFNIVGSNQMLMKIYRIRSFMNTLLLFNVHLMTNLVILAMVRDRTFIDIIEETFIVIFIAYTVMVITVGWIGVNYELIWLTVVFGIFYSPTIAFYIYKIVDVGSNYNEYDEGEGVYYGVAEKYRFIAGTMFFVCVLGIILYSLTLVFTVLAARGYKKGLNNKLSPPFKDIMMKILSKKVTNSSATYIVSSTSTMSHQ